MKDIGHVIGGAVVGAAGAVVDALNSGATFTLKSVLLTVAGAVLGKLTGTTRRKVRERREKKITQTPPGQ